MGEEARCRGCGKKIVWALTEGGGRIPLDPSAPVYHLDNLPTDNPVRITRVKTAMVNHFNTCPKASEFSGRNKK